VVSVHSSSHMQIPNQTYIKQLNKVLKEWGHDSLWADIIRIDGGQWLIEASRQGSLVICHDGSFMPSLDPTRCSAATIFICTTTGIMATSMYCEKSDADTASNYQHCKPKTPLHYPYTCKRTECKGGLREIWRVKGWRTGDFRIV
jgi:hypothetical protein